MALQADELVRAKNAPPEPARKTYARGSVEWQREQEILNVAR
jgi:hypothetical protein